MTRAASGLMVAIELVKPGVGDGRTPDPDLTKRIQAEALARKLIVLTAGTYVNVVRIIPPLVTTADEVDMALAILDESLAAAGACDRPMVRAAERPDGRQLVTRVAAILDRPAHDRSTWWSSSLAAGRRGRRARARRATVPRGGRTRPAGPRRSSAARERVIAGFAAAGYSGTWAATEWPSPSRAGTAWRAAAALEEARCAAVVEDLVDAETVGHLRATFGRTRPPPGSAAAGHALGADVVPRRPDPWAGPRSWRSWCS